MMEQSFKINISDLSTHEDAVKQLIDFANDQRIFLFDAAVGAGKTTFIKAICRYLGVTDSMSSPTYSIVNEYNSKLSGGIFHFDLYRLKSLQELADIGFEDYIASGNYVFIEWPELAIPFLDSYMTIRISSENNIRYLCAQSIKL